MRLTPVIRDPFPFSTLLFAKLVKFGVFSDFLNFLEDKERKSNAQCGNLRNFLSFGFYVKSNLAN